MPQTTTVKKLVRHLADNPADLKALIDAGKQGRKVKLHALGPDDLDPKVIAAEIQKLLTAPTTPGGSPQRAVEWVAAIATLAAGALAA